MTKVAVTAPDSSLTSHVWSDLGMHFSGGLAGQEEWGSGRGSCLQLGFSQHRSAVCPLCAGSEIRFIGDH